MSDGVNVPNEKFSMGEAGYVMAEWADGTKSETELPNSALIDEFTLQIRSPDKDKKKQVKTKKKKTAKKRTKKPDKKVNKTKKSKKKLSHPRKVVKKAKE